MAYSMTNVIYTQIKDKILKGEYKPAQNLTEAELASEFNASRVTVKKALLMLERESLVESQENRSTRVRTFNIEEITQYLQTRILLEGFCAELTAPVISDEAIANMEKTLEVMHVLYEKHDLYGYSDKNVQFHRYAYDECPNRVAVELILDIRNKISRYNFKTILVSGRVDDSFKEHLALLEAYRRHDSKMAKEAIITHVTNLLKSLEENFKILFM